MLKNIFAATLGLALLTTTASHPKPAHAMTGVITGSLPAVIAGASLAGLGGVGIAVSAGCQGDCTHLFPVFLGSVTGSVLGLLILDGSATEFGPLSASQARALGVSRDDLTAYLDELAELNAIQAQIMTELGAEYGKTGEIDILRSQALWADYGKAVSPEALSVAKKISVRAIKRSLEVQQKR